jgi:hypothetical protein
LNDIIIRLRIRGLGVAIALDPNLMLGLPPGVSAATGMNALTHAVEARRHQGQIARAWEEPERWRVT